MNLAIDSRRFLQFLALALISFVLPPSDPVDASNTANTPQLFVVTTDSNSVAVIDSATDQIITQIPVGSKPSRLAMTPDGRKAYVSNGADNTLSAINTANRVVTRTIAVGGGPQEIAVTPDGGRVFVVRKSSGDVALAGTSPNTVVTHVAIGGNGSETRACQPRRAIHLSQITFDSSAART